MAVQLIDTHVHLNFDSFSGELDLLRHQWTESGVSYLIHSCVEPQEFPAIQAIANRYPEVFFAVGLHPLDVAKRWTGDLGEQIQLLGRSDDRLVAIGETGLDFFKADNEAQQIEALLAQVAIARKLNKPLIIHCRDAAPTLKEVLSKEFADHGPVPGVMHCWTGSPEETQWFLDLGLYISFSGIVTFKSAKEAQASARMVPSDRLLVETDCPFLAPVPNRGKRNEPAFVRNVAEKVATLRNISFETLAHQTYNNARNLFDLPIEVSLSPN